jgi:protein gp37
MGVSKIEWTWYTMNFWEGCQKVSPGCQNCYAWRRDLRLHRGANWGPGSARLEHKDPYWRQPIRWNLEAEAAGQMRPVFCGSLMDCLEDGPGLSAIRERGFELIRRTPALMWLLLTKRPENAIHLLPTSWYIRWPHNVMLGISGEDDEHFELRSQILLRDIPAKAPLFLSAEPLLGNVASIAGHIDRLLPMFSWVIGGGESQKGARPFHPYWARALRDACKRLEIPFMWKQNGEWDERKDVDEIGEPFTWINTLGQTAPRPALALDDAPDEWVLMRRVGKKRAGRKLDGRTHDEFPKFWDGLNVVTVPADPLAVLS